MHTDAFDVLILVGRPASGKSEIIDYLMHLPPDVRRDRFHVANLDVLDDFPMLWAWFEEDGILSHCATATTDIGMVGSLVNG